MLPYATPAIAAQLCVLLKVRPGVRTFRPVVGMPVGPVSWVLRARQQTVVWPFVFHLLQPGAYGGSAVTARK
jgi:hypothetical protein